MNIGQLRSILASFGASDEITPAQFSEIEIEVENILAEQRQADERELEGILARAAKLQEKLGVKILGPQPPRVGLEGSRKTEILPIDETDAGNGIREPRDEGGSAQSFQDELAALRERTQAKRRRLG